MREVAYTVCNYLQTRDGRLTKDDKFKCEELYKLTQKEKSNSVIKNLMYRLEDILIDYSTCQ